MSVINVNVDDFRLTENPMHYPRDKSVVQMTDKGKSIDSTSDSLLKEKEIDALKKRISD